MLLFERGDTIKHTKNKKKNYFFKISIFFSKSAVSQLQNAVSFGTLRSKVMKIFKIEINYLIFKNLHFCSFFDEKQRKIEKIIILWNLIIFRIFTKFTKFEKGGSPLLDIRKAWLKRHLKAEKMYFFTRKKFPKIVIFFFTY